MEDGLSHNSINCFLHCSNGYLLIGTFEGVNIYDGYKMRPISSGTQTLSNNFIECLYEDTYGNIWIGTQNGLNRYSLEDETITHYLPNKNNPSTVAHNVIKSILQDKNGNLWIGTYGGGLSLYSYETDSFSNFNTNNSKIQSDFINTIVQDIEGTLWLGTWLQGLIKFDNRNNSFQQFIIESDDPDYEKNNTINCIIVKRNHLLWLGTWKSGIKVFNTETLSFESLPADIEENNALKSSIVKSILPINNYETLIGTFGEGLFQLYSKDHKNYHVEQYTYEPNINYSLGDNSIWSLYLDRSGLCWVATWGNGVNKIDFDKNKFLTHHPMPHVENQLKHNYVTAATDLSDQKYLIGTIDGGFYSFNSTTNTFKDLDKKKYIQNSKGVTVLSHGTEELIWIGTREGLYRYNPKSELIVQFKKDINGKKLSQGEITSIYTDEERNIWVGIRGKGIDKLIPVDHSYDRFKIESYGHDVKNTKGLSANTVTTIFGDYHKNIWIGTLSGGLDQYNVSDNSFRHIQLFDQQLNIRTSDILSLHETKSGEFWIGTLSNGLWKFNRKNETFQSYNTTHGLPNNSIYGIMEDANGNLWLTTGFGISKFNPLAEKFANFYRKDGLHGNNLNFDIYTANSQTVDQAMLFGGKNGFTIFYPEQIIDNLYIPEVVINQLMINGRVVEKDSLFNNRIILKKSIGKTKQILLTRKEQIITFEFASLHYANPENNRYEYILEGFDEDWLKTDASRRFVTYTNLPPGSYKLKVRASNSNGVWHPNTITTLEIKVRPPFWLTYWFFLLLLIPVGLIVWVISKSRTRFMMLQLSVQEKLHETEQIINEKQLYKLEQEKLSLELDKKNKELATNAVFMDQKNQRLKTVKEYLTEIGPYIDDKAKDSLKKMNALIEENANHKEDWESFEKSFDILHDDFMKRFTNEFPKITHKDLRMVGYIRMNYSNKEIAELLNISIRSVESSRYRLRKKMELESDINLNDFIIRY